MVEGVVNVRPIVFKKLILFFRAIFKKYSLHAVRLVKLFPGVEFVHSIKMCLIEYWFPYWHFGGGSFLKMKEWAFWNRFGYLGYNILEIFSKIPETPTSIVFFSIIWKEHKTENIQKNIQFSPPIQIVKKILNSSSLVTENLLWIVKWECTKTYVLYLINF